MFKNEKNKNEEKKNEVSFQVFCAGTNNLSATLT